MPKKSFLIPVSAAVAALIPMKAGATASIQPALDQQKTLESTPPLKDTEVQGTVQKAFTYPLGTELHSLILRQSGTSQIFAGHGSHSSHYSHQSHRSHRSGY